MKNVSSRTSIWLVNTLLNYGRLSLEDLRTIWNESQEFSDNGVLHRIKLQRIIASAQDIFGIVIECDRRDGYRYYIAANTNAKAAELLISSQAIRDAILERDSVRERILLEDIPSGQYHLSTIISAISKEKALEMVYRKFSDSEPVTSYIEPYCVKISHQRWYLLARKDHRDHLQVFALDRILKLRILQDHSFTPPADFSAHDYFNNYFGVHTGSNLYPSIIRIRVDQFWRNYFRTLPLHHSQREVDTTVDDCIFEYTLAVTPDFVNHLLSYGASIEVLEPQSLRQTMLDNIRRMSSLYDPK